MRHPQVNQIRHLDFLHPSVIRNNFCVAALLVYKPCKTLSLIIFAREQMCDVSIGIYHCTTEGYSALHSTQHTHDMYVMHASEHVLLSIESKKREIQSPHIKTHAHTQGKRHWPLFWCMFKFDSVRALFTVFLKQTTTFCCCFLRWKCFQDVKYSSWCE